MGGGGVKLSNASQPTSITGDVRHVYITCPEARTQLSPLSIALICVCVCVRMCL